MKVTRIFKKDMKKLKTFQGQLLTYDFMRKRKFNDLLPYFKEF